ncbi:helix-turn-helix domain-containing protein [Anaeromonas gelatinilytica]|uniref:helix-turn-helix domain-containing protein n=1 Tax=Anaeromonas gelatinilytica TaxID=2683194 RepID=UPI002078D7AF|nr:helix-turn-helix transcriptional regulator [Anaeromonas gelatinilytica]
MNIDIGLRFREIRMSNNLSANKLADGLNINPSTLTKIENGNSLPSIKLLINFCDYFNISLSSFFDNEIESDSILTPELKELLYNAKDLTPEQLTILTQFLKALK